MCHEIPVRYAVNAAAGSDELDARCTTSRTPRRTSSTRTGLCRAVDRMRLLAAAEYIERA